MNKKGNVLDGYTIIIALFSMVVTMLIMGITINIVSTALNADPDVNTEAKSIITHVDNRFLPVMDFWAILFLVGFPLISAIFAYFNNIHPLFFWASLGFIILIVLMGASLQVFWDELAEDALIKTSIDSMPMANYIFSHYGIYSFFVFVVVAAGTFIKLRQGGGAF